MWQKLQKNWQGLLLSAAVALLLTQGMQAQSRGDTGQNRADDNQRRIGQTSQKADRSENARTDASYPSAAPVKITQAIAAPSRQESPIARAATSAPQIAAEAARASAPAPVTNSITATSKSAPDAEVADLVGADRLNIKFQGQPELSGDYRVSDDQTISIPVLGRVSIARLDAAALEQTLAERVARVTGREAYVTVEIAEYRPVFVSGYVSRPGTAAWKPGLTILQAITIAGGDYRSGPTGSDGVALRAQRAIDDQKRYFAQIARLEAERSGATKIELPKRLIERVGQKHAQELIDSQNTVFQSRRSAADTQVAGLQRAIALTKTEFDGMAAQKLRLAEQLDARRGQFAKLKTIYDKGLLRNDRLVDEQIKLADLEEKIASIGVSTSRASSTLVGLERELSNIRQDRHAAIDAELLKLERDVAQLDIEIQSLGVGTASKSVLAGGADAKDGVIYEIVRQERSGARTIAADRYTLLRPGDMVVVSMKQ